MPEDNDKKQSPGEGGDSKDPFGVTNPGAQDSGVSQEPVSQSDTESSNGTTQQVPAAELDPQTDTTPSPDNSNITPTGTSQSPDAFMASGPGIGPETSSAAPVVPETSAAPSFGAATQPAPASVVGGVVTPGVSSSTQPAAPKPKKKWLIPVLIGGGIAVLAAALFGFKAYTSSPNYVWNKSIENTQKAYQTLDTQLQKSAEFKGSVSSGTLSFTADNSEITGSFKAKSAGESADVALDLSFSNDNGSGSAVKLSAGLDMRVIGSDEYPDIYIRARDLDKVASLLGSMGMSSSEINSMVSEYNNQWYVLEGSYLQQLSSTATGGTAGSQATTMPDTKEIYQLVSKLGKVSSEYIFATQDGKAVLVQKEFVGKEEKNGRATYHYKAEIDKAGLKAYGQALKKVLADDATARSLMSANDKAEAEKALAYLDDLSKNYKDNETAIDIWVDSGTKLVQTVRFSDPKNNKSYMELSQLYDASDKLPLQVVVNEGANKATIKVTVDTKKNENTYDIKATTASGNLEFAATESFTNTEPKIEKPGDAKSIEQLLNAYMGVLMQNQAQNQALMQQYMSETQTRTN